MRQEKRPAEKEFIQKIENTDSTQDYSLENADR